MSYSVRPSQGMFGTIPSPWPSPHPMGRGNGFFASVVNSLVGDDEASVFSLSPSDAERAGVRGFVECIATTKPRFGTALGCGCKFALAGHLLCLAETAICGSLPE